MTTHAQDEENDNLQQDQNLRNSSSAGLRPVTLRQVLDATQPHSEARFRIDGNEVDRISTVAHVVRVWSHDAFVLYELEDGTNSRRIRARQWRSNILNEVSMDDSPRYYVHIVGHIISGFKGINALDVQRIHKVNETDTVHQMCFHMLEAAFVTLCYEHGPPPAAALAGAEARYASMEPREPLPPASLPTTPERVSGPSSRFNDTPGSPVSPLRWQTMPHAPSSSELRSPQSPPSPSPQGGGAPTIVSLRGSTPVRSPTPLTPPRSGASTPAASSPTHMALRRAEPQSPSPFSMLAFPRSPQTRNARASGSRRESGIKKDPYADLTALQRAILLEIHNAPSSDQGTSVIVIVRGVSHHDVTADQIGDALDLLVEQGYIETTIDDAHYAVKTSHYPMPL